MRLPARSAALLGPVAVASALVLLAAGCSDETAEAAPAIALPDCAEVDCEGSLDGAAFELRLPDAWNGTLLIYSHGYRQALPSPPDFEPVSTQAQVASTDETAEALLAAGYALAGSAYASNGWAVREGVEAAEGLYTYFSGEVAEPERVYLWGDSLGGLITEVAAEESDGWVDGAAPLCGVVGGPNPNLDLALDVAYALKKLVNPDLKLTDYASFEEAAGEWEETAAAIEEQASVLTDGPAKIRLVAALADAAPQTSTSDGSSLSKAVRGYAESLLTALGYGTFGRWEIEQRVGGNASSNVGVDYASRISPEERSQIDSLSGGRTDELLAELSGGRVAADAAARTALDELGTPSGDIQVPTITLHTAADPLVIVQNETLLAQAAAGSDQLLQLYTVAPYSYEEAPYGAGHCNFTTTERTAVIELLDDWVRTGERPDDQQVRTAFGPTTGLRLGYQPQPWPAEQT